jgi:hypothetical protein
LILISLLESFVANKPAITVKEEFEVSNGYQTIPNKEVRTMRKIALAMVAVVGMMALAVTVFCQTNLTVVRHPDNTIWMLTCEGDGWCSPWTKIGGGFSTQPTLTWDPTIQKYLCTGIGNNGSNVWRTTFNADGTWNNDWVLIGTGATGSPSPVASAGGGFRGSRKNIMEIALLRWYGTNTTGNSFPVGDVPWGVAFDGANIWVTNPNSDSVSKL